MIDTADAEARIRDILGSILSQPLPADFHTVALTNLPDWDSLAHANFVMALEEEFDVTISPELIDSAMTPREIVAVVRAA